MVNIVMKATYLVPSTEVMQFGSYALLTAVSGAGLNDGGQAGDNIDPQ